MDQQLNLKATKQAIATSELGPELLKLSDDGYNVIVGSTPQKPILFTDYSRHPRTQEWIDLNHDGVKQPGESSDAAGRYQFMGRYWGIYMLQLKLPDFGHDSQERWCNALIKECKAWDDALLGNLRVALTKCKSRWASLPEAGYGQHQNKMDQLVAWYEAAGGVMA